MVVCTFPGSCFRLYSLKPKPSYILASHGCSAAVPSVTAGVLYTLRSRFSASVKLHEHSPFPYVQGLSQSVQCADIRLA